MSEVEDHTTIVRVVYSVAMTEDEARGDLERTVLTRLRERGWEVSEATRRGLDLDLAVAFAGTRGTIRFRNAFEVPRGTIRPESSPTFLRIDLGAPDGEPSRWAVWDHYEPPGNHEPGYVRIFHEAIGEAWASVAGCSVASQQIWYSPTSVIDTLLARAEALVPGRDETARREQIFLVQRRNFGSRRGREIVDIVVSFVIATVLAVAAVVGGQEVAASAKTANQRLAGAIGVALICGLPTLVLSILGLVKLIRLLRAPRRPLEGMTAIEAMLRGAHVFSKITLSARKDREALPVVVRDGKLLAAGAAQLSLGRLLASSLAHKIALEADLCRMTYPEGTAPESRLVPDRWLTVELSGDESELAKLPRGPREERRDGIIRWTFRGDELDAGEVEACFRKLTSAVGAAGPYR